MTNKETILKLIEEKEEIKEFLKSEYDKYIKSIESAKTRESEINVICSEYFVKNKKYCPLEKLKDFANKQVKHITFILADGNKEYFRGADFMNIDENGRFYLSDFNQGIIEYDVNKQGYYWQYRGIAKKFDIVGFYNLHIGSCWESKLIEETSYEYLLTAGGVENE